MLVCAMPIATRNPCVRSAFIVARSLDLAAGMFEATCLISFMQDVQQMCTVGSQANAIQMQLR